MDIKTSLKFPNDVYYTFLLSYLLGILQKNLSLSPDGGCQGQQEEHPQGYATKPIEILYCHLHYNRYPLMAATHTWIA